MIGTRPNELMRRNIAGTGGRSRAGLGRNGGDCEAIPPQDRKSTRLNSSHLVISHADFCFKKKYHIYHLLNLDSRFGPFIIYQITVHDTTLSFQYVSLRVMQTPVHTQLSVCLLFALDYYVD